MRFAIVLKLFRVSLYCIHGIATWQTVSLANWDILLIGGDFGLANRTIFTVYCFMKYVIIGSVGIQVLEARIAKLKSQSNVLCIW